MSLPAAVEPAPLCKGKYNNISHALAVRFCGSVNRRYNVYSDVCCWNVMSIEDYPADQPNPITREPGKGDSFGLTCWEVLQWFTHDMDMETVRLNGVHPETDDDHTLFYEPSDQYAAVCASRVDTTDWTMAEQIEFFHKRENNLLKTWLLQVHPQADLASLTSMACRGRASNRAFPSNVVAMMHLPIVANGTPSLPSSITRNINEDYDLASMPVELQVVLLACNRYNMIPTKMLLNVDLEFTFQFASSFSPLKVNVFLALRDSFHHGFREFDPTQKLQVR